MLDKYIPVYQPRLLGNEKKYVNECLDSTWISSKGSFVERFEKDFSEYIQVPYSTTVSNGTVALHLALLALGVGQGDEVIVPTLTYIASVNAIAMVGAIPVFVDSLPDTWNIDPSKIEEKISTKTKAVMVVHLYGAPCDMDPIKDICKEHRLFLIEDAAEAFGSKYKGKYVGGFGDISTFSFFGNKTITTGEGGMVVTHNKILHERSAYLKSQAVSSQKEYWHDEIGYNFRMTNICAAIGVAQLEMADSVINKKCQISEWYKNYLKDLPVSFQNDLKDSLNTNWMVSILAENEEHRDGIRTYLKEHNIETRPLFYPAHIMPTFKSEESFPVADFISKRGLNLPSFPDLSKKDVEYVCSIIEQYFKN
ncbi:DegT/DnrJ/EryC1/StrS family aminotransferase [Aquirufa nivalisilvae]